MDVAQGIQLTIAVGTLWAVYQTRRRDSRDHEAERQKLLSAQASQEAVDSERLANIRADYSNLSADVRTLVAAFTAHDKDCIGFKARQTTILEQLAAGQDKHANFIAHLQAQMAHVASGAAGRLQEK